MNRHKALYTGCMALLFSVVFPAGAQDTLVVECPQVASACPFTLYLSGVTCTPQSTALELKVYEPAGNVLRLHPACYLLGQATGKKYRLLRAEGIVPGEKKAVPDEGVLPFTLYFDPLDAADDCFDFVEDSGDDGYSLKGIVLHSPQPAGKLDCHIEGTLRGEKRNALLLVQEYGLDERIRMPRQVPVEGGRFAFDLPDTPVAYELFDAAERQTGAWTLFSFFAAPDTVWLSLDLAEFMSMRIDGGALNSDFARLYYYRPDYMRMLRARRDSLMGQEAYLSPEAVEIREAMRATDNDSLLRVLAEKGRKLQEAGRQFTPMGRETEELYREFVEEWDSVQTAYMRESGTLPGYFFLLKEIGRLGEGVNPEIPDTLLRVAERYAALYPHHPFTGKARELIASLAMNRTGSRCLDFVAEDLDGTPRAFSDLRKGKIVFLDLWASWCGPCRRHSKEMIPVYEAYKDKGFTVIAVAREAMDTKAMQAAMEQDGYPWPSLVDLDDRHAVWERLGVGNAGGKTWLIDRDGTILLVNPAAEEVRKYLAERLD